ncbi:MAG: DUF3387 domain-containing protein [Gemmatimonadetes bacterium]|nr:MAG: DUF3387 domain-containing protein [Gemmatimonadota bacterium]
MPPTTSITPSTGRLTPPCGRLVPQTPVQAASREELKKRLAVALRRHRLLRQIALKLVEEVRKNATIDWQLKESVQAKLRVMVKRILRRYKYPPDDPATGEYTESVTKVLSQAELLADFWTQAG